MSLGTYRSASYGESVAASGYGYSRYVDCNSALALLGFILFVDILRDIIEDVTTEEETRRRRAVARTWAQREMVAPEPDVLTFISQGGADHLYDALPHLLPPLMEGWWKDEEEACVHRRVCESNLALARDYGAAGRILGTLLSNVVSRVISGGEMAVTAAALEAARMGRRGGQTTCKETFPACPTPAHALNTTTPAQATNHLHHSPNILKAHEIM